MKKPFFSIIIPTLNEAAYLPELLEDLSNQSFRDFEVFVVDGKSKDKTIECANTFKTRLNISILNSHRAHVCTQRNLGAKAALANILIFSDADNRLPPYFLQGIKYRWELESVDILSPFVTPNPITPQNKTIATAINLFLDLQMSIKPHFLLESCVIVSKKCFDDVGGFDEKVNYSEGNVFIEKAISLSYSSKIIKDPQYSFSFRRLKKYGTSKVISRTIGLQLMDLFGLDQSKNRLSKLYPMLGGSSYNTKYNLNKNKISKFLKNITKLIKDF